jgi:DNA-binding GntR family transcriptional regulator
MTKTLEQGEKMSVDRTCMRDKIRDAIVARIIDGSYPPGTHLKEMALANEFNVSQAPVREALRELEALSLLESERYCGTRVRGLDLEELREAYELRAEIEDASARRAVPVAKADLDRLENDVKLMRRFHREHNTEAYMESAVNFHRHIVQLSGNRLYLRAWENMAWDIRVRLAVQRFGLISVFDEDRKKIIAALRSGDGVVAGQLLRGMLEQMLDRLAQRRQTETEAEKSGA